MENEKQQMKKIDKLKLICFLTVGLIKEFIKNLLGFGISDLVYENSQKIHAIAQYGNDSQLIEIIDSGISFNHKNHHSAMPIHFAVLNRDSRVLYKLLECGADVHCSDCFGLQPIHYLAKFHGPIANLKIILDRGASINVKDYKGKTALYYSQIESNEMKLMNIKPDTALINSLIIFGADLQDLDA